eukprot:TRINITY_DN28099_c0_g1_i1.p1 TRINITY_DN28099_c0_g1~~TRINITY_DN28099_c0_g1_i1.p1  ORF type:complete len:548 (+),score=163.76 TRINITY_DN28099_c0_g1_i1:158-1801(+)
MTAFRKRVILDMDNTMLHAQAAAREPMPCDEFQRLKVEDGVSLMDIWRDRRGELRKQLYTSYHTLTFMEKGRTIRCLMTLRPFLFEALEELHRRYDVYIYSNGVGAYVRAALESLVGDLAGPGGCVFKGVVSRDDDPDNSKCLKRLAGLFPADPAAAWDGALAVDDQPFLWRQVDQVVTIPPFVTALDVKEHRRRVAWEERGRFLPCAFGRLHDVMTDALPKPADGLWWRRTRLLAGMRLLIYNTPARCAEERQRRQAELDSIFRSIAAHGGEIATSFDDSAVTHFVVQHGTKYHVALDQDPSVHQVTFNWLIDTLVCGHRLNEGLYAQHGGPGDTSVPDKWRVCCLRQLEQRYVCIERHQAERVAAARAPYAVLALCGVAAMAAAAAVGRRQETAVASVAAALTAVRSYTCLVAPLGMWDPGLLPEWETLEAAAARPVVLPCGALFTPIPEASRGGWARIGAAQGRCQAVYLLPSPPGTALNYLAVDGVLLAPPAPSRAARPLRALWPYPPAPLGIATSPWRDSDEGAPEAPAKRRRIDSTPWRHS